MKNLEASGNSRELFRTFMEKGGVSEDFILTDGGKTHYIVAELLGLTDNGKSRYGIRTIDSAGQLGLSTRQIADKIQATLALLHKSVELPAEAVTQ